MTIDPKGTTPGLAAGTQQAPKLFNMKCRNTKCSGMQATAIQITGQDAQRMYRCTTCSHTWGLNVGGTFNL